MKQIILFVCFGFLSINAKSQATIGNAIVNEYNVKPNQLLNISISSMQAGASVIIEGKVINSSGQTLLSFRSTEKVLNPGINVINSSNTQLQSYSYGSSQQADYLRSTGRLASGLYNVCYFLIPVKGLEYGDEYCTEINSSSSEFLDLTFPYDKDTIDNKYPVLSWIHSESFNLLADGEFFKLTLVEKTKSQSAETAIQVNVPIFSKSYLSSHQVQYAFDATKLEEGKTYAWMVSKHSNGLIINRTEAWEFTINRFIEPKPHKYVTLKTKLDGSFYSVVDGRIYFKLDEKYSNIDLNTKITNEKGESFEPVLDGDKNSDGSILARGYNTFELDVEPYNLKKGYYYLHVIGAKGTKYKLKFHVN